MDDIPERIGPYSIVGLLGEGGSGKVYLAEQTEPLRRTVALKVLDSTSSAERSLGRFEIERLALAVMDHPSIAKIYDAGITDDGHPYVVMERVDGVPIGQYCDDARLTIRERVRLFAEACRAVHHAHQKGVIHRDLKPSHLLVTEDDGRPRLRIIDFGIAVALEKGGGLDVGRDDKEVVGTPGYMSPEQMEGSSDIDTRSDIYSLGVILYELLVGVPPFDFGRRRGWAAVAAQLEDLPTPTRRLVSLDDTQDTLASHRSTTPRGLRRALHGDLDSIVTRAMSKDRVARYETARDLWLDLERYLAYEPVEARDGGPGYRVRRFARRHRVGVAFGLVVLAGLASVGATAAVQATRIAEARDEASARRAQAEGLVDFMLNDLTARLEPLGRLDLLDAVGEEAMEYLAATPGRYISEEELARRSDALLLIGRVRDGQGDLQAAREAYGAALGLSLELVRRSGEDSGRLFDASQAHFYVGYVDFRRGDYEGALEHLRPYLDIANELVSRDPSNVAWRGELAFAHSNLGSVFENQGRLDEALAEFTLALETFAQLLREEPDEVTWGLSLADSYNTTGDVLRGMGRLEEARDAFREEVRVKQELVRRNPSNALARERLATGNNYLASALLALGDRSASVSHLDRALRQWTELVELDPSNALWRRDMARSQQQLANILSESGDLTRALALLSSAEAALEEMARADSANLWRSRDLAELRIDRAMTLRRMGRSAEALAAVAAGQQMLDALVRETPSERDLLRTRGEAFNAVGLVHADLGSEARSRAAWAAASDVLEPLASDSRDPRYVVPWLLALLHLDRVEEARPLVRRLEETGFEGGPELTALLDSKGITHGFGA